MLLETIKGPRDVQRLTRDEAVALDREHARLLGVHRAVRLVGDALRGLRYVPRL